MKLLQFTLLILINLNLYSQNDYKIQINDTIFDISLDTNYKLTLNGEELQLKLFSKDTLFYDSKLYGFNYPNEFKISPLAIEEGVEQIMLMTAEGTGLIIQEFSSINPTMLNELMISEISKESLNYGFKMKREDYSRTLKSGQKLEVDKAILTYKDEMNIYEVSSIGNKDEGIIIITLIMDEEISDQGREIIEMMWNSLVYKK
jgi:hypothetical protein